MMAGPNTWYQGAKAIYTGRHVQPAGAPVPMPLGVNVPGRRILLVADAGDVAYVVSQREQGQTAAACAAVGMRIPQIQADGNYTPLEFWVNNISVLWICGAAGGEIIFWVAEEY